MKATHIGLIVIYNIQALSTSIVTRQVPNLQYEDQANRENCGILGDLVSNNHNTKSLSYHVSEVCGVYILLYFSFRLSPFFRCLSRHLHVCLFMWFANGQRD